jgi:type II secretory pathway pseudopilin PulG
MKRRAFTYLELLVALSLFTVGMVSILQIFPTNRRLLLQSANTTQAVFLAQEELESVRAQPYSNLTIGTYEAKHALSSTSGDPLGQYQRQTTVTLINGSHQAVSPQTTASDLGLKQVDTTVYWTENTIPYSYTLSTYVYSP